MAQGKEPYGILLVDNFPGHPSKLWSSDGNFVVLFLPPNTTPILQPVDQHLVASTKKKYRALLLPQMLDAVLEDESTTFHDIIQQIQFHDFGVTVTQAWSNLTCEEMVSAWRPLLSNPHNGKTGTSTIIFLSHRIGLVLPP